MRKTPFVIAILIMALVSGCAAMIEGEYETSNPHRSQLPQGPEKAEMTLEASNYGELFDAVNTFIAEGVEYGVVMLETYDGDMEADLAQACLSAANDVPFGAYAVYYINYSLNRIVSYYEADVSVIYKRTPEELAAIGELGSLQELDGLIKTALEERDGAVTLHVSGIQVTEDDISRALDAAYYGSPETILYFPSGVSVEYYPTAGDEYIVEIELTFPYTESIVDSRMNNLNERVDAALAEVSGEDAEELVESMCAYLAENVDYDEEQASSDSQSRWYGSLTAYGALVQRKAVGEGYAMALKLLCDRAGVDCVVVRGRHNNIDHAWNLVRLENGEYYHVDCTAYDPNGAVFMNDAQMRVTYRWDESLYPECNGGSLYEGMDIPEKVDQDAAEPPEEPEAGDETEQPQPDEEGAETGTEPEGGGETEPEGGETEAPPETGADEPPQPEE